MPPVAWVTMVIAALIIGITAVGLLRIVIHLHVVRRTLGAVVGGADIIAQQTRTVPTVLPSVNATLRPVRDFCESV